MKEQVGDFALINEIPESDKNDGSIEQPLIREIPIEKDMYNGQIKLIKPEIELINNREWSVNIYHRKAEIQYEAKPEEILPQAEVLRDEL